MRHSKKAFLVLISLLLAMACTVQKRVYRKGFYVHHRQQLLSPIEAKSKPLPTLSLSQTYTIKPQELFASGKHSLPFFQKTTNNQLICDSLYFQDGSVLAVKLLEIGPKDFKYKLCDHQDGPDYVVEKFRVSGILYSNGKREVFAEKAITQTPKSRSYPKQASAAQEKNLNAGLALSFGILGFYPLIIFGSLVGIVFSILAFDDFKKNPGRYSNETMAKAGLGLSIAGIVFYALLILLFFFI